MAGDRSTGPHGPPGRPWTTYGSSSRFAPNVAVVPAESDLTVQAFASNRTGIVLNRSGYFAP